MTDHHVLLHQLAGAKTQTQHTRAIHAATPAAGRALTDIALELTRHGHGPTDRLAKVQLGLLAHPDSAHADFKKAAENHHGDGLGKFLSGLAKGIFSPIAAIGKAIFHHPAMKAAAKDVAGSLVIAATSKAKTALTAKLAAKA